MSRAEYSTPAIFYFRELNILFLTTRIAGFKIRIK